MRRCILGFGLAIATLSAQDPELASRAIGILEQRCWTCHGPALAQSGLRLNSREGAVQGGRRGPALVPGNLGASRIVQAIRRTGELAMPPGPKLAVNEIAILEKWVASGAVYPKAATG